MLKMGDSLVYVFFVYAMTLTVTSGQGEPLVNTNLGRIQGQIRRFGNDFVFQFLGIRYAVPPVGQLRFQKPVPVSPWEGIMDASTHGPSCAQRANTRFLSNRAIAEDCLLLNVYVPRTLTPSDRKSVMVWFHGGGYLSGQGMANDGSNLALRGDVIVVTINFRVDVFGFLTTDDENSRGNYGLWDQHFAMRFVKQNIAAFGGDPNSITIFGESSGGYSVGLHALSPLSRGLFNRAICQSGVGISPRALAFDSHNFTRRFAQNLNCNRVGRGGFFNTSAFMDCVRQKNTNEILRASAEARRPNELVWRLEVGPTVDGELLPRHPKLLISDSNANFYNPMLGIDFMAGINSAGGNGTFWPMINFQRQLNFTINQGIPTSVLCDNIAPSLANDYFNGSANVSQTMCQLYSTNAGLPQQGQRVVDLYGDIMFAAPALLAAAIHSLNQNGRRTYAYLFAQQPAPRVWPWWLRGAGHGSELSYVFGSGRLINPGLSLQMMTMWSNFAKYGDPNGPPDSPVQQWQTYNFPERNYLLLGPTVKPETNLWPVRMSFWNYQVPLTMNRSLRIPQTTPFWDRTTWSVRPRDGGGDGNLTPGRNPPVRSEAPGSNPLAANALILLGILHAFTQY